jgi:Uma2 family endonuclease
LSLTEPLSIFLHGKRRVPFPRSFVYDGEVKKVGLPARKLDRRYTYADYRTWPDDERWELIDGVAWNMSPAPSSRHQGILGELHIQVAPHLKGTPCRVFLAPFDVLLPETGSQREDDVPNVVQPDLTVICNASRITERGCFGSPDWVVEILSPWTLKKDLDAKFALYERNAIREYWLIDPGNRTVHVYRLEKSGRYGDPVIHEKDAKIPCPVGSEIVVDSAELFAETVL